MTRHLATLRAFITKSKQAKIVQDIMDSNDEGYIKLKKNLNYHPQHSISYKALEIGLAVEKNANSKDF